MIVWVDASSRGLFVPEALTHEARGARFAPKIEHRGGEGVPSQLWIYAAVRGYRTSEGPFADLSSVCAEEAKLSATGTGPHYARAVWSRGPRFQPVFLRKTDGFSAGRASPLHNQQFLSASVQI